MKGKWNDILINLITRKEDGFKVWINNKLILESLNIKTFTPYTNKGAKIEWNLSNWGKRWDENTEINLIQTW